MRIKCHVSQIRCLFTKIMIIFAATNSNLIETIFPKAMPTNQATLQFIRQHAGDDVRKLALAGNREADVDLPFALEQIAGRQKAVLKIPSWAAVEGIIYPPHLSLEQCSSEQTARYKAGIAGEGERFVDLTAGFGVDCAFISSRFQRAVYVEQQPQLCAIASENFRNLGLTNIETVCGNGVDYLHALDHTDLLFIDPARRNEHGGRTYGIADCTPNVLEILDEMLEKANKVMIKLSPMLDWRKAVTDLGEQWVREVHIVSVDNECKELLLILAKEESPLKVVCVNLGRGADDGEVFEYVPSEEREECMLSTDTFRFLYEPNASIMKAGCFELIARRFGVSQLDRNSHLFVSDIEIKDFPGRRFTIERVTSMNKRELRDTMVGITQANIAVRNFPMTVDALRKRLKLRDGGDVFIFATTVARQGHLLFVCRKKS